VGDDELLVAATLGMDWREASLQTDKKRSVMRVPDPSNESARDPPTAAGTIRIGYVVHVMQVAGAEMLVRDTILSLRQLLTPTIFCLDAIGRLGEELKAGGVEVISLGRRPGVDLRVATRLAREIRSRRITLIHAHQYTPFFYAALAKVLLGGRVQLMLTEHGRHYPDRVSVARRLVNRLLLSRLADHVSACSDFSGRALAAHDGFPAARIEVIPNGVDLSAFEPQADRSAVFERLGLDPSRRVVVTIARFHPVKDHRTLLRAFSRVAQSRPDVDLLLVGEGPLRSELQAMVEALGLGGRVHFAGVRADVPAILRACDLFVLSSLSEAASLTLLEAMASETPVVVTAVGGNPEIVPDERYGRLVPRGDFVAMGEAMLELLTHPERARSVARRARLRVENEYRLDATIARYAATYRALCCGATA
jgi:glycosyltransferase involved in cell wall biosynthesis